MRAVIQRVSSASVTVSEVVYSQIDGGLLIFVGIEQEDNVDDINWLTKKIVGLRIFDDANKIPNVSIKEVSGDILLVSQFTLHASTKKGNRPSYIKAAKPEIAMPLYAELIFSFERELGKKIATGKFGADMKVALVNDGPHTILIDTKRKE